MGFKRITVDPNKMGGIPCIRDVRIPVATIIGMVVEGMTYDDILRDYPDLEKENIIEALYYTAEAVCGR